MTSEAGPPAPLLRVVRGAPSEPELAALVAVLLSRGGPPPALPRRSLWARPVLRSGLHPGAGAWRASSLPS